MTRSGRNVLVTGGCGSIGAEIVSELLTDEPNLIRIVDNSEVRVYPDEATAGTA